MGLFDKKYCDICGEKIKFLGNNKLEDGNMCNACEKKLSVWFKNRRHSTIADIKDQLAAREENARLFQNFRATRELGTNDTKFVLVDDNMGRFIILREGEDMNKNPELLELSKVQSARLDIKENKSEVKRKAPDGNLVSFSPPHYRYSYDFYVIVNYNGRFFNELKFSLNNMAVDGGTDGDNYQGATFMDGLKSQLGLNRQFVSNPIHKNGYGYKNDLPGGYRTDGFTSMADMNIERYQDYENAANEIIAALMGRSSSPVTGSAPVRGSVSPMTGGNTTASQADIQRELMEAIQSGDPVRLAAANTAMLNASMAQNGMSDIQKNRQILELKSQAMSLQNTDFYKAAALYRQAIDMGDKEYDDILYAYLNWINKPGSTEADCQELIRLSELAKASGYDRTNAENFIMIANKQLEMRSQGIQPTAYASSAMPASAKPVWVCEYCGKSDNTGKFCLDCGAAKP